MCKESTGAMRIRNLTKTSWCDFSFERRRCSSFWSNLILDSRWQVHVLLSFSEYNTCLACSKSYKWKKSLHRHVRESPECWPILLTSGNGEFIRQIHYKMLYNTKNWMKGERLFEQFSWLRKENSTKFFVMFYIWNIFCKNKCCYILIQCYWSIYIYMKQECVFFGVL